MSNLLVTGQSYSKCTACSDVVLGAYRDRGFLFLQQACNEPKFLEDLTGLTKLHEDTEEAAASWEEEGEEDGF